MLPDCFTFFVESCSLPWLPDKRRGPHPTVETRGGAVQVESGGRSREEDFGFGASRLLHFFCRVLSFADWLPKSKVQAYQIDLVYMYLPSNQGTNENPGSTQKWKSDDFEYFL